MGMFSLINEMRIRQGAPYWIPHLHFGKYLAREEYLHLIESASLEIKVVCGHCEPSFYNSPDFISSIDGLIDHWQGNVSIAFNKKATDRNGAEDIFREENKKLFEYFSSLSPDLKERFKLIWLRKRPEQHYLIIDRKSMVFESKHKEGEPREIYCVLENKKEAEKFLVFYNQLIKAKGEYLFANSGNKQ